MAQLFPDFETINRLKVPPTPGERALLEYLSAHLTDNYEVYFQPYFNGLRPDVVVLQKGWGVIIIEVKDWDLSAYTVNETNKWRLRHNDALLMSPHQQVFSYKKSMFDLHIEGLAEARARNGNFYKVVKPFVFFHGASKADIDDIFEAAEAAVSSGLAQNEDDYSKRTITFEQYEVKHDYLSRKRGNILRDRGMSLHQNNLDKVRVALIPSQIFTAEIYEKFKRYLQPPLHTKNQGRLIEYGRKQRRLIQSAPGFSKIKGVAGSGKTTVLAKRAVNALIRHESRVLILTFNLTLKNYIRDRINEVREDFSWGSFDIINYHSFVIGQYIQVGGDPDKYSGDIDNLYADENLFGEFESRTRRYQTILIDEIQDFERSWINIIRKYFLADDGEMVLFGDESQNIYNRAADRKGVEIVRGFGTWERLTVSYRSSLESRLTVLISDFQSKFLVNKYDIDIIEGHESESAQLSLEVRENDVLEYAHLDNRTPWPRLADEIYTFMISNRIQPNDICIVGGEIAPLRQLEKAYKDRTGEDTNTTFESQEVYEMIVQELDSIRMPPEIRNKELESKLDPIRRSKKYHFWQNRGTVKLSTVHSYKGLEARNIVYLLSGADSYEIVYTAITRSTKNLLVYLPLSHQCTDFFKERLSPLRRAEGTG
jgi:hypothetical protein